MEGSGRKSAASLSVVPAGIPARLEPPSGMPEAQADLWRAVVAGKPADWFSADSAPLLAEYVRAVDLCNYLEAQIDAARDWDRELKGIPLAKDQAALKGWVDMRDKEAKRAKALATTLRLTQQSRYTPQAAATADRKASGARPWAK